MEHIKKAGENGMDLKVEVVQEQGVGGKDALKNSADSILAEEGGREVNQERMRIVAEEAVVAAETSLSKKARAYELCITNSDIVVTSAVAGLSGWLTADNLPLLDGSQVLLNSLIIGVVVGLSGKAALKVKKFLELQKMKKSNQKLNMK